MKTAYNKNMNYDNNKNPQSNNKNELISKENDINDKNNMTKDTIPCQTLKNYYSFTKIPENNLNINYLSKNINKKKADNNIVFFDVKCINTYKEFMNQYLVTTEQALNGEDVDVNVTFPDEYQADLAGKEAVFKCKIHEIKTKNTTGRFKVLTNSVTRLPKK